MKKNKVNIVILILFIFLNSIILFGLSYYLGIRNFWNGIVNNNYLFKTFALELHEEADEKAIINELKANKHVVDIFDSYEYRTYGIIPEFVTDEKNGEIALIGIAPNLKKIVEGRDLNEDSDDYEIICPNDFFPDSIYTKKSYDKNKSINLYNKLDSDLTINYIEKGEEKFKLVGLFDRSYDYSSPNACYVTHKTLHTLNDKYFEEDDININNLFVILDEAQNIDSILENIDGINGYINVATIKTEVGDKVIFITGFITLFMFWIILIIGILFFQRKIVKDYKNLGIMMLVGYSNKKIKNIKYRESLKLCIISFVISILLSFCSLKIFSYYFLNTDPDLALTPLKIYPISLIVSIVVSICTILIVQYFALKKLDEMDLIEVIYE